MPPPLSRGREALVTAEQHARLMEAATPALRDALTFLRETGCRPAELCALTAAHVDLQAGVCVLAQPKSDRTDRPRLIFLSEEARRVVERLIGQRPDGPLFLTTFGRPWTTDKLRSRLYKVARSVGLKTMPYGYRHTYATDALANGVSDALVAELLGHSGTATLHKHYSHLTARREALVRAISRFRDGPPLSPGEGLAE